MKKSILLFSILMLCIVTFWTGSVKAADSQDQSDPLRQITQKDFDSWSTNLDPRCTNSCLQKAFQQCFDTQGLYVGASLHLSEISTKGQAAVNCLKTAYNPPALPVCNPAFVYSYGGGVTTPTCYAAKGWPLCQADTSNPVDPSNCPDMPSPVNLHPQPAPTQPKHTIDYYSDYLSWTQTINSNCPADNFTDCKNAVLALCNVNVSDVSKEISQSDYDKINNCVQTPIDENGQNLYTKGHSSSSASQIALSAAAQPSIQTVSPDGITFSNYNQSYGDQQTLTIYGSGFGSSGSVTLTGPGTVYLHVASWSDSQIVADVNMSSYFKSGQSLWTVNVISNSGEKANKPFSLTVDNQTTNATNANTTSPVNSTNQNGGISGPVIINLENNIDANCNSNSSCVNQVKGQCFGSYGIDTAPVDNGGPTADATYDTSRYSASTFAEQAAASCIQNYNYPSSNGAGLGGQVARSSGSDSNSSRKVDAAWLQWSGHEQPLSPGTQSVDLSNVFSQVQASNCLKSVQLRVHIRYTDGTWNDGNEPTYNVTYRVPNCGSTGAGQGGAGASSGANGAANSSGANASQSSGNSGGSGSCQYQTYNIDFCTGRCASAGCSSGNEEAQIKWCGTGQTQGICVPISQCGGKQCSDGSSASTGGGGSGGSAGNGSCPQNRDYNQYGGTCNGQSFASNQLVHVVVTYDSSCNASYQCSAVGNPNSASQVCQPGSYQRSCVNASSCTYSVKQCNSDGSGYGGSWQESNCSLAPSGCNTGGGGGQPSGGNSGGNSGGGDSCPGQHDQTGACNPACCSSGNQCSSGSCSVGNGYCQSGTSCQ